MSKTLTKKAIRERILALLDPHRKPVWVPEVKKGDPGAMASKYFGAPWLAADEAWPEIGGKPARFVLQLEVATLPGPMASLLGGVGLVQLFYQTDAAVPFPDDVSKLALARLVHPEEVVGGPRSRPKPRTPKAPPAPKRSPGEPRFGDPEFLTASYGGPRRRAGCPSPDTDLDNPAWKPKAITGWGERTDYPRSHDHKGLGLKASLATLGAEAGWDVLDLQDVAPDALQGDKLGGWPFWTQGDLSTMPCDRKNQPMVPVFQLDAGCFYDGGHVPAHAPELFAGDGTGHLFVSPTDPADLTFVWECG